MRKPAMTSKERVTAAFQGKPFDIIPLVNPTSIANVDSMNLAKQYFPFVHHDPYKMAALACVGHETLRFDTVAPYFSVCGEAAALGANVDWGSVDVVPNVRSGVLKNASEFKQPANYLDKKYIKVVTGAIKLLKGKFGDSVAIVGKVVGPVSLAFFLHGIQNTHSGIVLHRDDIKQFVDKLGALAIEFAVAQIDAGADIITVSDDASSNHISRDAFRYFAMDANKRLCDSIKPGAFTVFHCSGKILDIADLVIDAGFDALSFDSRNDVKELKGKVSDNIKLIGCINNPMILLNGSKEDIRNEVFNCINNHIDMVSPECAIPCRVTNQNLMALHDSIQLYYKRSQKP